MIKDTVRKKFGNGLKPKGQLVFLFCWESVFLADENLLKNYWRDYPIPRH
jgi:hypothetical protein